MRAYTTSGNDPTPRDTDGALIIGLMVRRAIRQSVVTVEATATKLPATPLARRLSIVFINLGTTPVYIGDSSVTAVNGFPIYPRAVMRIEIEDSIDIYGIVSSGTAEVRVLEGG